MSKLKMLMVMLLTAAMLSLAACGEGESPASVDETLGSATTAQVEGETSAPGNDKDLFVQIVSEASSLDSFSMTMTAEQQMDINGEAIDNVTQSTMDVIYKPELTFKQVTKVEFLGQAQEIVSYYSKDGFVMNNPTTGGWFKLPYDLADVQMQADQQGLDPAAQLMELIDYADQFSVDEKDGKYILKLKAQGEEFSELIQKTIDEQQSVFGQNIEVKTGLEIHQLDYTIEVEKSSKKLLGMDIQMNMTIQEDESADSAMNIKSNVIIEYSNHNEIKEIVIPEEALNAEEFSLPELTQ